MMGTGLVEVTCSAPVNIAVIKYWGKRDTELLLPTNSSLSLTLSQDHLHSKTTIRASLSFPYDQLFLNGAEEDITTNKRFQNVIRECRQRRSDMEAADDSLPKWAQLPLRISSENNFPTAAGLASSASGFACLTYALSQLYQLPMNQSGISQLARLGSGSACRSLYGGFVAWRMGEDAMGQDSVAVQVAPETHWPDMEALILVVSDVKKHTSSTLGMQTTVKTSDLLKQRIQECVPSRMKRIEKAIKEKDFDTFAEITMKDSNQFHAVCLDTFPPIFYLTDVSKYIIHLIHEYNKATCTADRQYRAAYTFDAGPNAVIYAEKKYIPEILAVINHFIPPPCDVERGEYFGRAGQEYWTENKIAFHSSEWDTIISRMNMNMMLNAGSLRRIISTHIDDGPRILCRGNDPEISLLDAQGQIIRRNVHLKKE